MGLSFLPFLPQHHFHFHRPPCFSVSFLFFFSHMRKLCPNFDRDDGLETVLEVPIPEEMFNSMGSNLALRCHNMLTWMKAQTAEKWSSPIIAGRFNELSFLLYIVGSPLIPLQVRLDNSVHRPIRDSSIVRTKNLPFQIHLHTCFVISYVMIHEFAIDPPGDTPLELLHG